MHNEILATFSSSVAWCPDYFKIKLWKVTFWFLLFFFLNVFESICQMFIASVIYFVCCRFKSSLSLSNTELILGCRRTLGSIFNANPSRDEKMRVNNGGSDLYLARVGVNTLSACKADQSWNVGLWLFSGLKASDFMR